jgi:hypothetical protein
MARTVAARSRVAVLIVTTLACGLSAAASSAAPSEQRMRIEGKTTTLFEGPLKTDGHAVKASSDKTPRRCDGTNNGAHATAGPTPTATADDAMRLTGRDFDAQWYPGFDDYFLQRFGPDAQDESAYAYWGILVNGIYTSVGGCQYGLNPGDASLWVYDAFTNRNLLRLDGPTGVGEPTADVEGGPAVGVSQQVFTVDLNAPFTVTTVENQATGDVGAAGYRRPVAGVTVAPVQTAADGTQTVLTSDPAKVVSDAAGKATLTWSTPGWKRIKADRAKYVRSNRLDVCVRDAAGNDCGPLPADVAVRTAPPSTVPNPPATPIGSGSLAVGGPAGVTGAPTQKNLSVGGSTISGLRVTSDGNPTALIGVRWTVLGAPLSGWRIEFRVRGVKGARWKTAKSGTTQTSALLDLPVGRLADLRIRFAPTSGAAVVRPLGSVVVPTDDRVRQVRFTGNWARDRDPLAWRLTLTRMRKGARLDTTVGSGRPTLVIRSDRRKARIELRGADGKAQRLTVPAYADGRTVLVSGRSQRRGSKIRVRVLSGTVRVDGVVARS